MVEVIISGSNYKEPPPPTPPLASAFGDTDGEFFSRIFFQFFGRKIFRPNVAATNVDAEVVFFLIISKNLPLKGKFFEMVSRALPPGGVWGAWPPRNLRALPPQLDVRAVKNLKMSPKRRTDLKN